LKFLQEKVIGRRASVLSKTWRRRGKPDARPWTQWFPLSPKYRKQKVRAGYRGVADNMRTGALRRASFSPQFISHSKRMTVFRIPPEQSEYAGYVNNGTSKMPARPFYDITDQEAAKLSEEIAAAILREGGF